MKLDLRLTPERLRILRAVGWRVGFGLLVFIVAFYVWFPYQRIKEVVTATASQRDLDVDIGSAGPILGVGIAFHDILVQNRPTDGTKPIRLRIDSARVTVSPLARLMGDEAYSFSADTLGGDIDVDWEGSKTKSRLAVKSRELAMADLPGVKESLNIPLAGKLGMKLDVDMPGNRLGAAGGSVSWTCGACAIGDGKSKLKIPGILQEGLSLPRLKLGDFTGRVVIDKGVGKLQGVQARSPDGEVYIEGEIRLADPLPASQVDLYVRFKLSDALLKTSDSLKLIFQLIENMGKRPDGFYGVRLTGSMARLNQPQWMKTSPFAAAGGPSTPRSSGRPASARPITVPSAPPPRPAAAIVDPLKDPGANIQHYPSVPPAPESPPPPPPMEAPPPPPPPAMPTPAPVPVAPEEVPAAPADQPDSGG
jgi:type II secretion system protein N